MRNLLFFFIAIFFFINLETHAQEKAVEVGVEKEDKNKKFDALLKTEKEKSLMFKEETNSEIYRIINLLTINPIAKSEEVFDVETGKMVKRREDNEKAYIYLGSIIYLNPKDWVVWLNSDKISFETNSPDKELYLEEVTKDHIKVLWNLNISKWKILSGHVSGEDLPAVNTDNKVEIRFQLRPNQTFILNGRKVAEGKISPPPAPEEPNDGDRNIIEDTNSTLREI